MERRTLLKSAASLGALGLLPGGSLWARQASAVSVEELPALQGELTLYLGRGEGGLYGDILDAIRKRNPELTLRVRRGPTAALANTLVAEARAGIHYADLFWSIDSGALGAVADAGLAQRVPETIKEQYAPTYRYPYWAPVSGRIRSLPYNTNRLAPDSITDDIMALADSDHKLGWAPAYGSFQSFITAMRITHGEKATRDWLRGVQARATRYAGELGVAMGVARGEVDLGFANHYYTLRLKAGQPSVPLDMTFTHNDVGCLLNASGIMALNPKPVAFDFMRYLLTREVQSYLATQAYEIPMVQGVPMPPGLPPLERINPPDINLTRLSNLQPTLDLMRDVGVL